MKKCDQSEGKAEGVETEGPIRIKCEFRTSQYSLAVIAKYLRNVRIAVDEYRHDIAAKATATMISHWLHGSHRINGRCAFKQSTTTLTIWLWKKWAIVMVTLQCFGDEIEYSDTSDATMNTTEEMTSDANEWVRHAKTISS